MNNRGNNVQDLIDRLDVLEKHTLFGNGRPSIIERLGVIENKTDNLSNNVETIKHDVSCIPALMEKIQTIQSEYETQKQGEETKNKDWISNKAQFWLNVGSSMLCILIMWIVSMITDSYKNKYLIQEYINQMQHNPQEVSSVHSNK